MKSSTLFFIISTAAINGTYAGCYGGEKWGGEANYAKAAVDNYCDPEQHESFTEKSFYSGQTRAYCYPLSGSKKADFSVTWQGSGDLTLAQSDCVMRLKNEIDGCDRGGSTTTSDWTFTADPNDGTCDPPQSSKREVEFTA
ncbi:hypothetical protein BJ170DRAFT_685433 [Xylariales sp. AK1849]|nr:hypothetical protein BJ170DRAFT_685433 [Xylariales sp. AK1849]